MTALAQFSPVQQLAEMDEEVPGIFRLTIIRQDGLENDTNSFPGWRETL